jgi:hypothetical protein
VVCMDGWSAGRGFVQKRTHGLVRARCPTAGRLGRGRANDQATVLSYSVLSYSPAVSYMQVYSTTEFQPEAMAGLF